jgi:hypothetical protein
LDGGTPISISTFRALLSSRRRMTIVSSPPSSGGLESSVLILRLAVLAPLRNSSLARMFLGEIWRNSTVNWRATMRCWTPARCRKARKRRFFRRRCGASCRPSRHRIWRQLPVRRTRSHDGNESKLGAASTRVCNDFTRLSVAAYRVNLACFAARIEHAFPATAFPSGWSKPASLLKLDKALAPKRN